mmetsp:Transcript_9682/g.25042  ORF Transcript_9682/g.25042 Transcript_9682/m.25042 type:complete len:456 (-) Transcript_9682:292-1659(-)
MDIKAQYLSTCAVDHQALPGSHLAVLALAALAAHLQLKDASDARLGQWQVLHLSGLQWGHRQRTLEVFPQLNWPVQGDGHRREVVVDDADRGILDNEVVPVTVADLHTAVEAHEAHGSTLTHGGPAHRLLNMAGSAIREFQTDIVLVRNLDQRHVCRCDHRDTVTALLLRHRHSSPSHIRVCFGKLGADLGSERLLLARQNVHSDAPSCGVVNQHDALVTPAGPSGENHCRARRRRRAQSFQHGCQRLPCRMLHSDVRVGGVAGEPEHADVQGAEFHGAGQREHQHRHQTQSSRFDFLERAFMLEVVAFRCLGGAEDAVAVPQLAQLPFRGGDQSQARLQVRPDVLQLGELPAARERGEQLRSPGQAFGQGLADLGAEALGPSLRLSDPLHQHPATRLRDGIPGFGDVAHHAQQLSAPSCLEPDVPLKQQRQDSGRFLRVLHQGLPVHGLLQLRR